MSTKTKNFGRGKYSYNPSALNANIQFDSLLCENKPSAAKSAGTIGKWGVVSYTSIRSTTSTGSKFTVGKRNNSSNSGPPAAKKPTPAKSNTYSPKKVIPQVEEINRPKKFFKSRGEPEPLAPLPPRQNPVANRYSAQFTPEKKVPEKKKKPIVKSKKGSKRRKTYSSSEEEIDENEEEDEEDYAEEETHMEEIEVQQESSLSPAKRDKPPIVLRIFKGNSAHDFKAVTVETSIEDDYEEEEEEEEDDLIEQEEIEETAPVQELPPILEEEQLLFDDDDDIDDDNDDDDEFKPKKGKKSTKKKTKSNAKKKPVKRAPTPVPLSAPVLPRSSRLRERVLRNSNNTVVESLIEPEPAPTPVSELPEEQETDLRISQEAEKLLGEVNASIDQISNQISKVRKTSHKEVIDKDRESLLKVLESDDEEDGGEADKSNTQDQAEEDESQTSSYSEVPVKDDSTETIDTPPIEPPPVMMKVPPLKINFKHVAEAEWGSDSEGSDSVQPDSQPEPLSSQQSTTESIKEDSQPEEEQREEPSTYVTRKGSIFKSRAALGGNKKRQALYKHKWVDDKDNPNNKDKETTGAKDGNEVVEEGVVNDLVRVTRQAAASKFSDEDFDDVTGVTCPKKAKKFYTVVKNVKKAHQIQESGEFQEFNDDVEYILDALQQSNPIGTRCLSAITLASKCMAPEFRMHLRAHSTVAKFFKALQDATKDQSLGMCTATVMFVLSQDRLNMDLDRDCLELMLNLLESDTSHKNALDDCGLSDTQLHKTRTRVKELCAEIQSQGHAKHLNLENITVGHLAMETLLSLTSKRAGEWFKEELRELGGLEHIIRTIVDCCKLVDDTVNAWSPPLLEKIRKVDRCLRVLENVTYQNEENKNYLLEFKDGVLVETLCRLYKVCDYEIPLYPTSAMSDKDSTGAILRECLIANLKVLINLTQYFKTADPTSSLIGGKFNIIESSLHVLLQIPQHIPENERFDLSVYTLLLIINLVESNTVNRAFLISAKAPNDLENTFAAQNNEMAIDTLVKLFYSKKESAIAEEKKTDKLLDGEDVTKPSKDAPIKVHEEFIEETFAMLLQKAGSHMEYTIVGAYIAVLLGYLILDNKEHEQCVRHYLPEQNFKAMIEVLEKFFRFMTLTMASSAEGVQGLKAFEMIIKALKQSDEDHCADAVDKPETSSTPNEENIDSPMIDQTLDLSMHSTGLH